MYQVTRLPNGIIVATAEMPHMCGVSVGLWVATGSRYEAAPVNGVCHFIEHMLFKGTRRRSAREISEAVEGVGGYLNAYTSEEATCFHARASHDRCELLIEVLLDMLLHSRFDPADITKEREVIREELAMYLDEPQHQVQEVLNATLWPGQPLGRPITGTPASLDGIHREEMLAFLRENYVSGASVLVASGRVRHRSVVRAVSKLGARFRTGCKRPFVPATLEQDQPRFSLVCRKTEQTQVAIGFRTCSRHDSRRFALRLLNTILGENMSSRLFQVVREDRGLAYSIYSTPSYFEDTGDLVISAGLEAGNLVETLGLIFAELQRLRQTPPSVAELRRARDYVLGQVDLSLESTENQMNWVGEQLLGYGSIHSPATFKRRLGFVKPADIRAVAREFFRPDRLSVALVSPLKSDRSVRRAVRLGF